MHQFYYQVTLSHVDSSRSCDGQPSAARNLCFVNTLVMAVFLPKMAYSGRETRHLTKLCTATIDITQVLVEKYI